MIGVKFKLVDDWKDSYKWLSVHLFALIAAASGAWYAIPMDMKASIPPHYVSIAGCVLGALGIVARLTDQTFTTQTAQATQALAEQPQEPHRGPGI